MPNIFINGWRLEFDRRVWLFNKVKKDLTESDEVKMINNQQRINEDTATKCKNSIDKRFQDQVVRGPYWNCDWLPKKKNDRQDKVGKQNIDTAFKIIRNYFRQ